MNKWRWNYYTLESLSIARCTLCDATCKPVIRRTNDLKKHIRENMNNTRHAHCQIKKGDPIKQWDLHYLMVRSTQILHPHVKCKYCHQIISTFGYDFIRAPKELGEHLHKIHNVDKNAWHKLQKWILEKAANYGITYSEYKKEVMNLKRCEKCNINIKARNGIMVLKHLITRHSDDIVDFPPHIIPKELNFLISNRNEDIVLSREQPPSDPSGTSSVKPSAAKDIALSREQPPSDPGVISGASPVKPSAAKDIALSSDQPSSDPRNIPGTSLGTSAQEHPSSSKRKRDSSTETDRKRKKFSPIYDSEDSD